MSRAGIDADQRVIDVGCGAGGSTFDLARRVGPAGDVLGIDVSRAMLDGARQRVDRAALDHVRLAEGDAQRYPFEPAWADHIFSRFGLMFFTDTVEAFGNLLRALADDGRLTFVCWDVIQNNPWMLVPREVAARHVALPEPSEAYEPGPFRFADTAWVEARLTEAGFAAPEVTPIEGRLLLGGPNGTLDSAVEMLQHIGPAAEAFAQASDARREALVADLHATLAGFVGEDGVRMPYRAWCFIVERA